MREPKSNRAAEADSSTDAKASPVAGQLKQPRPQRDSENALRHVLRNKSTA
jgi:hypothetical protein